MIPSTLWAHSRDLLLWNPISCYVISVFLYYGRFPITKMRKVVKDILEWLVPERTVCLCWREYSNLKCACEAHLDYSIDIPDDSDLIILRTPLEHSIITPEKSIVSLFSFWVCFLASKQWNQSKNGESVDNDGPVPRQRTTRVINFLYEKRMWDYSRLKSRNLSKFSLRKQHESVRTASSC